ncbi:MAG: DUF4258 domain-containing protein [Lachnospiraceae bacterium]|nr:DUF4258 domain-containing protein [Lachnospiraceae bacterium]
MDLMIVRELIKKGNLLWSVHCVAKMQERGISRKDVLNCISSGEIIEDYPDDYPTPSCLIFGMKENGEIIHTVAGCDGEKVYIITAYKPNKDKTVFEDDLRTRKDR